MRSAAILAAMMSAACSRQLTHRLAEASQGVRFTEARLHGFDYAPVTHSRRGVAADESAAQLHSQAAATELLNSAEGTDRESQHARALARLVHGDVERAASELARLASRNPADASVWSDLAAVRYEHARRENDAQGFASALAAASSAISNDPALPEARFNYALAAAALGLKSVAVKSFRRYLAIDPRSAWSEEVRQRLSKFDVTTVADEWRRAQPQLERMHDPTAVADAVHRFPQQTRAWAEGEYLANWAVAYQQHREVDAAQWLALAHAIGEDLATISGETLLRDAVRAIEQAPPPIRARLANAHVAYRRGRMTSPPNSASALVLLAEAEQEFSLGRSPIGLMARLYRVNVLVDREENAAAAEHLEPLLSAPSSYLILRAYALYDQSLLLGRGGLLFQALKAGEKSELLFERLGELENASRALTSLAATYMLLGRPATAWRLHQRAFTLAATSGSVLALDHALRAAARGELHEERNETARALFDLELTLPALAPRLRVDALLQRIKTNAGQGDFPAIRRATMAISDTRVREEALDDVNVAEARQSTPAKAYVALTRSIEFRKSHGDELVLAGLYVERARILHRLSRDGETETDLSSALALIERQRAAIVSAELRDTFFDTAKATVDELFGLYLEQARYREAFDLVERTRARGLVERLGGVPAGLESWSASTLARRLPPRVVVAQFTWRNDTIAILALYRNGFSAHVSHCPRFDDKVAALTNSIQHEEDTSAVKLSEEMWNLLISPLASELRGAEMLVVIPDERVAMIPFAALRNRTTGRYLIEEFSITVASSASAYARASNADRSRRLLHALLIGDPAVDSAHFPDLPPLPSAANEVEMTRRLYPSATVLTRGGATRSKLLREISASDAVHIGAHAIVNSQDPSLSLIALAPDGDDIGVLYLRDIARLRLSHKPVVVLAGCQTASRVAGYGSLRSLATAFLAAGSRATIGSLWNVDDAGTSAFSLQIHRNLAAGISPAVALRNAQLSMLHSPDDKLRAARSWSGFQAYIAQ